MLKSSSRLASLTNAINIATVILSSVLRPSGRSLSFYHHPFISTMYFST